MTDHDTFDPRDELASAHLDGETTSEEAAQVEGDADLLARVAALQAVRGAVRAEQPPVDDDRRESAIAAALAAFDAPADQVVVPITAARRPRQWARAVGIAAAVVLAAAIVPLLSRRDDTGDQTAKEQTTAAADDAATGGSQDASRSAEAAPSADAAAPYAAGSGAAGSTALMVPPEDLGAHADIEALATALRTRLDAPATTTLEGPAPVTSSPSEAVTACIDQASQAAGINGEPVILTGTAVLAGRPVVVVVVEEPAGGRTATAYDPVDGCTLVGDAPV